MIGDRRCGIYKPGHQVHPIQARKAAAVPGIAAELLGIEGSTVVLVVGDGVRRYGNHDPRRLLVFMREHPDVFLVEPWGVLRVGGGGHRFLFSVMKDGPQLQPCGGPP